MTSHKVSFGTRTLAGLLLTVLCLGGSLLHTEAASEGRIVPRLPPLDVLKSASRQWEQVKDYQGILHQIERHPNGKTVEQWATVILIKEGSGKDNPPIFLVKFYDQPVTMESEKELTPVAVYFSDDSGKLFTYKPQEKSLTVEWLKDSGPIPEFLYIAGFVDFDLESLREKAYFDKDVWEETVHDAKTYRVKIVPDKRYRENEPPRFIWINQETQMPERFSVEGDVSVQVEFLNPLTNRGLDSSRLIPEIPSEGVTLTDLTENHL